MPLKLALTISPPARTNNKLKNPNRHLFIDDKYTIQQIFKYNKIKTYIIYPEIDEKGRLHYHGIITLNNTELVRFEKHARHKLKQIGFVDTTDCTKFINNLRYIIYMSKDWLKTKEILEITDPIMSHTERLKKPNKTIQEDLPNILDYFK